MIHPKKRNGAVIGYEVRAYNPFIKKMAYVGFRKKEKGAGGAKELERNALTIFEERESERTGGSPRSAARTCNELALRWIADRSAPNAEKRWRDRTRKHNEERIQVFLAEFGEREPDSIPREEALEWARGGVAVSCSDVARAMLNHSQDLGLCRTNPLVRPGIGKGPGRKNDPPLTEDDLGNLMDSCVTLGTYADAMRGFILWQSYVGCRPGEALRIERDLHIDVQRNRIEIVGQKYPDGSLGPTKNGQPRTVIFPKPAWPVLDLIPPRADSKPMWLFHSKTGKPLLYGAMLTYWTKVVTKAGLDDDPRYPKGIDPYHLRHFCGSHLADQRRNAADIAIQLGHTDGGVLAQALYIHTYEDRALERLEGAYDMNVRSLRAADAKEASA